MIRAKIRENTMISTIWGLSSLFFPLCVCMIPQTKWVGKVQAQFTEENILYSSQQAGLLSVKQNQQRDLSHRGRHCAASLWPQRLNRQAVKGTPWTGHAEGAATHACAPRPPNTHTRLSVQLLFLLSTGSGNLFGYFSLESYYSWNISKETAPWVCTSALALIGAFQSVWMLL